MNERRMSMTLDIGADISKVKIAAQELQNLFKNTSLDPFKTKNLQSMFNGLNDALADLEKRSEKALSSLGEGRGVDASKKRVLSYIQNIAQEFQELENLGDTQLSKKIKGLSDSLEQSSKAFDRYEASMKSTKDQAKDLGKQLETLQDIQKKQERLAEIEKDLPNKRRYATRTSNEFNVAEKNLSIAQGNKTRTENRYNKYIEENAIQLTQKGTPKVLANQKEGITQEQIEKANQLYEAYDKAAKAYAKLNKDTQDKQDKRDTATKELTDLENEQKTLKTSLEGVNDTLEETKNKVNQTQEAIKSFNQEGRDTASFEELKKTLKELFGDEIIKDIDNTKEGIQTLKDRIENISTDRVKELRKLFPELFNSIKGLGDSAQTMGKKVDEGLSQFDRANEVSQEINQLASRLKYFFSLAGGFQLMRRAIRSAVDAIKELDAVMTQTAVVSENTVGDMWKTLPEYSQEAKKLGAAIKDVYSAQTLYVQQGLDMNSAMDLGVETLKMARVAGIDAAAATDTMTAALRGFKMELNEVSAIRINDVYSKLAQNTASNVQEISTAMSKVASLANSANMSFENTAAFLAKIIESTREGAETAGTALKTVIARFSEVKKLYSEGELTGTDEEGQEVDVNKISAALRTAGINMNDFFTGAKGLDQIFIELGSKWDSLTTVQQRYIATMAAGSRQQSRFLALMQDFSRTTELTGMAYNSAGSSQEQFEKTLESLESKLNKLKDAWQTFIMGIANSDIVKGVIDTGTKILEIINNIINSLSGGNGLIKSILSVAAAVGVFKAGGALLKGGLGKISTLIGIKEGKRDGEQYKIGFMSALQGANGLKAKASAGANFTKQKGQFLIGYNKNGTNLGNKLFQKETTTTNFKQISTNDVLNSKNIQYTDELGHSMANYNRILSECGPKSKEAAAAQEELSNAMKNAGASEEDVANMTTETTTKMSTDFSKVGMAASTAGMLIAGLGSILESLGLEEAGSALKKFGAAFAAIGGIVVLVGQMITAAGIESQLAWWWVLIIVAALAALVIIVSAVAKQIKSMSLEERMKKAAERTKEATEEAQKAREAYEALMSEKTKYNELQGALDDLVEGTDAFKEALVNANQQVIDLIGKYSILAGYISKGKYGQLIIEQEGFDKLIEQQQKSLANANAAIFSAKVKELELKNEQITGSGHYGIGTIAGNAIAGSAIGAATGMLLGPIGSMVGSLLSSYFASKNTANQQIYTSKAFKKFQNSEDSELSKSTKRTGIALGINAATMLIPVANIAGGAALPFTALGSAIDRQISKRADQKRFKTIKDKYDQYGLNLLDNKNQNIIEELAEATDMSVDAIRDLIIAIHEDEAELEANNKAMIAMNKSMLDTRASDKVKEFEYADIVEQLFAQNIAKNVTQQKIRDYEQNFLYYGRANTAAAYGESTFGSGIDIFNSQGIWKGGAANSKERADYLAQKYAEYGVTRDQLTGKYLHDMQVIYAAMKGINVEDIGDGLKEDKTALGNEVARMTLENQYAEKMDAAVESMQKMSKEEQKTFAGLLTGNASSFSKKELEKIWVSTELDRAQAKNGQDVLNASTIYQLAQKAGFDTVQGFAETLGYIDKNWKDLSEDEKYKYARQYIQNSNIDQKSKDEYLSMSKSDLIEKAGEWDSLEVISAEEQFEWEAWNYWQTMQKAYENASKNLGSKGIEESAYKDYSIETVSNLSEQVSKMGDEQAQDYIAAFNKVLSDPRLSEEQRKSLESMLSFTDLTDMSSLTAATQEMFAAGLDINVIEAYWDAAVAGSGAYVHNLQEALSLGNQIQNNMSKATDREKRLSEGSGTFEDVQRALDLGIDLNLLHRTANGWVMEEEGIKQYQEAERERAAFESRQQAEANKESVKVAKERAKDSEYFKYNEETGQYELNDWMLDPETLSTMFMDPDSFDSQVKSYSEKLGITSDEFIKTYLKDGILQSDYLGNALKEKLTTDILEPANQDERVQEILDKDAEFYDIWKQTGSADAVRAQGYDNDTQRWAAISEATEKGLDVTTLKDYADHIQQITDLEAGMAHTIALDNMIMNEGIKDLASNFETWEKALENPGTEEYSQSIEGLRTSMQKITGSSHKFSENFLKDTKTLELFKKAAEGDTEAINELRKAGAKDILNLDNLGEAGKELNDLIDNLDLDEIKIGATLDDVGITNAFQALLDAGLLTAEQVNQALESIGFEPKIDWVEAEGGSWDEMHTKYTLPNGQTYTADSVTESNGKVMIPVINGEGSTYKGGAGSTVNTSNRKGGGGGGGGGGKEFKNDFDKYYNMVEDINELQRLRNLLETDYEQLLKSEAISGKAIYDNLKKQIQLLKERRDITADLAEKRKGQIFETMNDKQYASVQKYAWWNDTDQTIEIDWDAINKVKDSEQGDLIKEYVSKLEGFQSQYDEQIEALEDIESTLQEIQKRGQEEYTSLEDRTRDALIKQIQDKIDELTAVDEAINDTNQKLMDSIQKELEKQRQERENAKTEEELADKEQRLAYLQQDSSGANALEIAKLQEELADARESYTDSLIDQKITELQEQNDEAAQQRQEQIDLMQQSLDWQEKSGAFWEQVYEYIQAGTDEVGTLVHGSELENLLKAGEAWDSLSEEGQMKWLEELENQVAQAIGYLSLSRQLEEIGTKEGTKITFTDAEGNTHTGTVDKNGNVVVKNADGSTTTWKDVYQSYDGSYQTLETQENAQTTPKPATNSGKPGNSSGNNGSTSGNNSGGTPPPQNQKKYGIAKLNDYWVYPFEYSNGTYTKQKASEIANQKNDEMAAKLQKEYDAAVARYKQLRLELMRIQSEDSPILWEDEQRKRQEMQQAIADKQKYAALLASREYADKRFKTGGLADYTGPAWLDGTPSKPELVLNARDTENFIQLKDHLAALRQAGTLNAGGDNYYDIDVHVDSLGSDYDVDMAIDRIKTRLYQDGAYRNVNTLNRLR